MNKHKVVAWVSQHLCGNLTYTQRHGLIAGMRRKGGLGWLPFESEITQEQIFWREIQLKDAVIYDIGAFHGILTLYFANQAKHVVAYEPNSRNRSTLETNVRLNGLQNVTIRPVGLGAQAATAEMRYDPLMPGTAAVSGKGQISETIHVVTLDEDIAANRLSPPDFLKVDTEGLELAVLQGAAKTLRAYQPTLFLEMHGAGLEEKRRKTADIVAHLDELGYAMTHVESGNTINKTNAADACVGHIHATRRNA